VEIGKVKLWLTKGDKSKLLSRENDIPAMDSDTAQFH